MSTVNKVVGSEWVQVCEGDADVVFTSAEILDWCITNGDSTPDLKVGHKTTPNADKEIILKHGKSLWLRSGRKVTAAVTRI